MTRRTFMSATGASALAAPSVTDAAKVKWSQLWNPPATHTLSEWAEKNFYLSPEYSRATGQLSLYGWQREIFDSFTDPTVNKIVLKVGTQLIKTLFMQAAMAYVIAECPGPILLAQPKDEDAKTFSKERIAPMIRDIPAIHDKVSDVKSRDSKSTIQYKQFPGGVLTLVGAGAPGNAARRSIQIALLDEVNKYPLSTEGNFVKLVEERLATFGSSRKLIEACSPTTKEGEISQAFEDSDQNFPYAPCQKCGEFQILRWGQVRWDNKLPADERPASAYYECEFCSAHWSDLDRWNAANLSTWRASKPFTGTRGFGGLGHLYSPWKTLGQMVKAFLSAKDIPADLQTFVNTNLAEDWEVKGESPEWRRLYERSRNENHRLGIAPRGVLFLTAGADVQRDRIEIGVRGWGRNKQSWIVDYIVLEGKTSEPDVWLKLTEILDRTYPNVDGFEFRIAKLAIDTGYATQDVYNWVRNQAPGIVMAVKGMPIGHQSLLGQPSAQDISWEGQKIKNGVQVWPVGVASAKSELYGWLGLPTPTGEETERGVGCLPGYCHLSADLGEEFFEQLTAEELVTRRGRGNYTVQEWVKRRERNEVLDAYGVYARAAAASVGIDRLQDDDWAELEARVVPKAIVADTVVPVAQPASNEKPKDSWVPKRNWFKK